MDDNTTPVMDPVADDAAMDPMTPTTDAAAAGDMSTDMPATDMPMVDGEVSADGEMATEMPVAEGEEAPAEEPAM